MRPSNAPSHTWRGSLGASGPHVSSLTQPEIKTHLAEIAEPVARGFHDETPAVPTSPPVRRKPLPVNASRVATRFTEPQSPLDSRGHPSLRSASLDSTRSQSIGKPDGQDFALRDLDV